MARKIVGLIGRGTGPKVFVGGTASVEVLGAEEGFLVGAKTFQADGSEQTLVFHNGKHIPLNCHYLQFSYDGPSRSMICNVHLEA